MSSSDSQLVVVTGGAGFIGSHTVGQLLDQGHRVVVLDNFSTGKRTNLDEWADNPNLRIVATNIVDGLWPALTPVVNEMGPVDRIIHLAAQTAVITSIENPLHDVRLNFGATVHVLEYARYNKVKKVVFASSAAVYGDIDALPVHEEVRCVPVSPYGIDKLGGEHFLTYYAKVHGVPTTSLRFFNVYGPRQDPSSPYSGVISIFFDRARAGQDLKVFGDGKQTRDFVYVGDVARALVRASLSNEPTEIPINIGTGTEVTVSELAELIVETVGSKSEVKYVDARPGEILRSVANVTRSKTQLDFMPSVSIRDGLAETSKWFAAVGGMRNAS